MYALDCFTRNDCIMDSLMNRVIYGDDENKWEPKKHRIEVDDKNFILDEEDEEKIKEADPLLDPEDYLSNEEYEDIVGRKLK